jgi:hypothetical protein
VASNGVVVRDSNNLGGPIAGFGFDGREQWRLIAPAVTRIGDQRVIALTTDPSAGYVITAHGDIQSPDENG